MLAISYRSCRDVHILRLLDQRHPTLSVKLIRLEVSQPDYLEQSVRGFKVLLKHNLTNDTYLDFYIR
jgi:hypothetical protein